mgnify:CR=1
MSIILSKKLEDEVLKDNFPSSFSIEPYVVKHIFLIEKHHFEVMLLTILFYDL